MHKAGCLCWPSAYARIPKKSALVPVKGVLARQGQAGKKLALLPVKGVLARQRQAGKSKSFFLPCPYTDCQQKVWLRSKVCLPTSRSGSKLGVFLSQESVLGLDVDPPASNLAKYLSGGL